MIQFPCPACREPIKGPDAAAGREGICPHCKATVTAPNETPAEPTPESDPAAKKESAQSPPSLKWYCVSEGKRLGPMTLEEIRDRIADGRLGRSDKVWAEGFTDWRPAGSVDALFPPGPPPLPEPASGDAVTLLRDGLADVQGRLRSGWAGVDRWAWALVTVPVVGALIELLAGRVIVLLFFFLNSVCGVADERRLRFAGLRAPNAWWAAIVVPVYLWKRAANLRRPPVHFGLWCASFVVALILSLSVETRELEDAARPLVTQIIRQQVGEQGARCIRVRIIEDVGDGYYRAIATLDNGNDLRVVIESRGRMVYVRVAP